MNKHIISGMVLATAMLTTTAAIAGPDCTEDPQDKWMSELDMQKKIINDYSFTIDMFKVTSGNCYEIYGREQKEGAEEWTKTEIYFHPVSGDIVQQKDRS